MSVSYRRTRTTKEAARDKTARYGQVTNNKARDRQDSQKDRQRQRHSLLPLPRHANNTPNENEDDELGHFHAINQPGEQFGLVGGKDLVVGRQALQPDRKFNITRRDNVADNKIAELDVLYYFG